MEKPCDKCGGKRKADYRFCSLCAAKVEKAMRAGNYLTAPVIGRAYSDETPSIDATVGVRPEQIF